MTVLLLCGYRTQESDDTALGVDIIDRRVLQLKSLGLDVVSVLAGPSADVQLRLCPEIADTELVYDTNHPEANLTTNIKAGLHAVPDQAVLVVPVEIPLIDARIFNFLRNKYLQQGQKSHIVQAVTDTGALWQFGFPLLVTPEGNSALREWPELHRLTDTRLNYLRPVYPPTADLASDEKPL